MYLGACFIVADRNEAPSTGQYILHILREDFIKRYLRIGSSYLVILTEQLSFSSIVQSFPRVADAC